MSPDDDKAFVEELLKRPSSFPDIGITMRKFDSEENAREIGNIALTFLKIVGTRLNLERLEAVTIAFDYNDALAQVDRGNFKETLTATQDNFAVGVGMAVPILRGGLLKAHIVLAAPLMCFLKGADDSNCGLAMHLIAHEAAHVHDFAIQDRSFPGLFGTAITDSRDATLFEIAHICWQEYIASRLSAGYAPPNQTEIFESTFCSRLTGIRERSNARIREYRKHLDVMKLLYEIAREYGEALKYGAYLVGHIDGLGQQFADVAPKAIALIEAMPSFSKAFEDFKGKLTLLHQTYGQWTSLDVFKPLNCAVHAVLKSAGIEFEPRPNGQYFLRVPFTLETM